MTRSPGRWTVDTESSGDLEWDDGAVYIAREGPTTHRAPRTLPSEAFDALVEAVKAADMLAGLPSPTDDSAGQACSCCMCDPVYPFVRLCPTCGNKRCPHATDHRLRCTDSNEPGQPGSPYR